jgi:hypothetical protein
MSVRRRDLLAPSSFAGDGPSTIDDVHGCAVDRGHMNTQPSAKPQLISTKAIHELHYIDTFSVSGVWFHDVNPSIRKVLVAAGFVDGAVINCGGHFGCTAMPHPGYLRITSKGSAFLTNLRAKNDGQLPQVAGRVRILESA